MMMSILTPVLALVAWTLVVWFWMVVTRIPAMRKARLGPDEGKHTKVLAGKLPSQVQAVADNYNHLLEQPTIFYALAFYVHLSATDSPLNIGLAWAYVALRVVHSLVQNTSNVVTVRFYLFLASTACLIAIVAGQGMRLFAAALTFSS